MRQSELRSVFLMIVGLAPAVGACEGSEARPPLERSSAGDNTAAQPASEPGAVATARSKVPIALPKPGGGDSTPIIRQRSVFDGTTSVDVSPRILFGANWVSPETAGAAIQNLSQRTSFVDEKGKVVPAKIEGEPVVDPNEQWHYSIWVSPSEALRADTWYTLRIEHDPQLPVWDVLNAEEKASQPGRFSSRFFTGSAPRITRVIRDAGGSLYQIFLSEPIRVGSAVGQVTLKSGATSLNGCIWYMNACVTSDSPLMNSAFDFRLNAPSSAPLTAVRLGGTIKGSGRTVSESAAAARDIVIQGGVAEHRLDAADWKECRDSNGGAQCWTPRSAAR